MTALAGYTADGRETGHRRWCERLVHLRGQVFASRLRELVAAANERLYCYRPFDATDAPSVV